MQSIWLKIKPPARMSRALVVAGLASILLLGGCRHFPQPWRSTHATWMNATALDVIPPKSAACPRVTQPYCVDSMYYGHYGDCWRTWPEGWQQCRPNECYYPAIQAGEIEHIVEVEEPEVVDTPKVADEPKSTMMPPVGEIVVPRLESVSPSDM